MPSIATMKLVAFILLPHPIDPSIHRDSMYHNVDKGGTISLDQHHKIVTLKVEKTKYQMIYFVSYVPKESTISFPHKTAHFNIPSNTIQK